MRLQGRESAFMDVVEIFGDGDAAATLPVPRAASGTDASREGGAVNRELPFLVTHWLANFSGANGPGAKCVTDTEKQDAMNRLRRAAADVAERRDAECPDRLLAERACGGGRSAHGGLQCEHLCTAEQR